MRILKVLPILAFIGLAFGEISINDFQEYRWDLFVKGKDSNNFVRIFCRLSMITRQILLTSASCIHGALLSNPNQHLSTYTSSFRSIEINENDIYYHEDFSKTYDKSKRDIATVIIRQPIITNEIVVFTLPNNTTDVYYSSCYNPMSGHEFYCTPPNTENYFADKNDKSFSCSDGLFAYHGDPIICSLKKNPHTYVLVGLKESEYVGENHETRMVITNIGDLTNNINEKFRS
ncbi:uncharacterized protein LOC130671169 [Microplitis mediator]|uniref:uncharacterized protein LOC130671169 n=1 Tax=Microplitis mediator TaxID=375433 RepID=UPI002553A364|nr:uncharacterized protein LOC130671169 [Microplitis mediator]